ncbi:hypothetical protein NE237_010259 [Protea cynaroides]|uniref:Cathepsin propeptide inhibitor domain-containing protein n=1 Tax=Protea cynaroides TaxID=273540 RepID=A0A9Q0L037_9MAGN|nr:hypothetical protein NE237_010259 [Protea cynaroides]
MFFTDDNTDDDGFAGCAIAQRAEFFVITSVRLHGRPPPSMTQTSLLLFVFFTVSLVMDMSSINYDYNHGMKSGSSGRTHHEMTSLNESWVLKHGNNYNALGEKEKRFEIFKYNLMFIHKHNAENRTYKLGLNRVADLTKEEYHAMYLGTKIDFHRPLSRPKSDRCKGVKRISRQPGFRRNFMKKSLVVLIFLDGSPKEWLEKGFLIEAEILGKQSNDGWKINGTHTTNGKKLMVLESLLRKAIAKFPGYEMTTEREEISFFQSLSAQLWRSVTCALKLSQAKSTTFRMTAPLSPFRAPYRSILLCSKE